MHFQKLSIIWLLCLFTISSLALEIKALPQGLTVSQALYTNCLQRTQTQQLLKAYIMVGLHSSYQNPQKSLSSGVLAYDKRFKALERFFRERIKDAEHVQYLDEANSLWEKSKTLLEAEPTKESAVQLYSNFQSMIKLLGKTKILAKKSFKAVSMTGGLCRDPLYLSNLYLMKLWGADLPEYEAKMQKIIAHFKKNVTTLKAYQGSTDEIKMHIANAEDAFQFFTFMYEHKVTIPTLISKKADSIFLEIRTIKSLYGKMLK